MEALGPLIGIAAVLGLFGFALGAGIGAVIRRVARDPQRAGRIGAWTFGLLVGVGGLVAAVLEVSSEPPDPLGFAVLAFAAWLVVANAVTGAVGIGVVSARSGSARML